VRRLSIRRRRQHADALDVGHAARVQFDCWGEDCDTAAGLRAAVIAALNGYQGQLSDGTFLLNAELVDPGSDFYEDDSREVRCMVEFYLLFNFTSRISPNQ
jgi:hypothetical protein